MRNPEIRGSEIYENDSNPGNAFSRDRSFLETTLKKAFPQAKVKSVTALWGDASTRRYFRIFTGDRSFIGQINEPFTDQNEKFPFLEVQKHLKECAIAVPEVYSFDAKTGVVIQQDLGDLTLLKRLQSCEPELQLKLYKKVVSELLHFHEVATFHKSDIEAFDLAFDTEKLFWEMEFAIKYFFEEHLQKKPSSKDRKILTDNLKNICETLAFEPRVFTHRDFHSRNILLDEKDNLHFIDFQDSRMGLRQYDLCSLLRDSYFQLEEDAIYNLVGGYFNSMDSGVPSQKDSFIRNFDLCTIQRNFKAIGTFCYIEKVRNNPQYLKYVGNTFENIKRILTKFPEYSDLKEVLFKYYYF